MTCYEELKARGLIAQVTNEEEISKMINEGKAVFYIGFDPTADSLHGSVPDEAAADGREPAHRPHRRRNGYDRRPLRPHRYAPDDDPGDHPAQLRLLQEADGAVH